MNRREFGILGASAAALFWLPVAASAYPAQQFRPGVLKNALDAGQTVVVNFTAEWSRTCAIKREVIAELKAQNPDYAAHLTFIDVDWDTFGRSLMAQRMDIPRRSTVLVRKGNQELDRIVAQTDPGRIKALLDTALQAATG